MQNSGQENLESRDHLEN